MFTVYHNGRKHSESDSEIHSTAIALSLSAAHPNEVVCLYNDSLPHDDQLIGSYKNGAPEPDAGEPPPPPRTTRRSRPDTLISHIAQRITARINCAAANNQDWYASHTADLQQLAKLLPSGSGVDGGTSIDLERSQPDKIVLHTAYHHMNDGGMYDGWTDHVITVRPSFIGGLSLQISGRNRAYIKDYLSELFADVLCERYVQIYDVAQDTTTYERVRE